MEDVNNPNPASGRQPNRLQRRAPASLQIGPVTEWKAAIPLLSPLVLSPASDNPTAEIKSCSGSGKESATAAVSVAEKPAVVLKKWQHPAAPFSYEPAPFMPFVHTAQEVTIAIPPSCHTLVQNFRMTCPNKRGPPSAMLAAQKKAMAADTAKTKVGGSTQALPLKKAPAQPLSHQGDHLRNGDGTPVSEEEDLVRKRAKITACESESDRAGRASSGSGQGASARSAGPTSVRTPPPPPTSCHTLVQKIRIPRPNRLGIPSAMLEAQKKAMVAAAAKSKVGGSTQALPLKKAPTQPPSPQGDRLRNGDGTPMSEEDRVRKRAKITACESEPDRAGRAGSGSGQGASARSAGPTSVQTPPPPLLPFGVQVVDDTLLGLDPDRLGYAPASHPDRCEVLHSYARSRPLSSPRDLPAGVARRTIEEIPRHWTHSQLAVVGKQRAVDNLRLVMHHTSGAMLATQQAMEQMLESEKIHQELNASFLRMAEDKKKAEKVAVDMEAKAKAALAAEQAALKKIEMLQAELARQKEEVDASLMVKTEELALKSQELVGERELNKTLRAENSKLNDELRSFANQIADLQSLVDISSSPKTVEAERGTASDFGFLCCHAETLRAYRYAIDRNEDAWELLKNEFQEFVESTTFPPGTVADIGDLAALGIDLSIMPSTVRITGGDYPPFEGEEGGELAGEKGSEADEKVVELSCEQVGDITIDMGSLSPLTQMPTLSPPAGQDAPTEGGEQAPPTAEPDTTTELSPTADPSPVLAPTS